MSRQIIGKLRWAEPCEKPDSLRAIKHRGIRAAGIRYENSLAVKLSDWQHNPWFQYCDASGFHYCQPDLMWRSPAGIILLEVKLTWVEAAHRQLQNLYLPVVRRAFDCSAAGIVVVKGLRPECDGRIFNNLLDAASAAAQGQKSVFQWLGGWAGLSNQILAAA